jgi:hypothetical protein
MPRRDTRLESEGAEFLVLGRLLIEGIDSYKSYRYSPGYDLVAVSPENNQTARIQIKSRWATDANGFLIKNLSCDFVVLVKLNRGFTNKRKKNVNDEANGRRAAECYVLPIRTVRRAHEVSGWAKVRFKNLKNLDTYKENWKLIQDFLKRRK